jgi:hypothetical protein
MSRLPNAVYPQSRPTVVQVQRSSEGARRTRASAIMSDHERSCELGFFAWPRHPPGRRNDMASTDEPPLPRGWTNDQGRPLQDPARDLNRPPGLDACVVFGSDQPTPHDSTARRARRRRADAVLARVDGDSAASISVNQRRSASRERRLRRNSQTKLCRPCFS